MVARTPRPDRSQRWVCVRSLDVLAQAQVERGGPWTVHSVFARACNLQHADGTLLGIVEAAGGNAPATLVLAEDWDHQPVTALVQIGATVDKHDEVLYVGQRLRLSLRGAAVWQPVALVPAVPLREIARRLRIAQEVAGTSAAAGGLAPLLSEVLTLAAGTANPSEPDSGDDLVVQRARQLLSGLSAAIRESRWSAVREPARALSGLGPGLTPAGDDLLAGLALGLRAALQIVPPTFEVALSEAVVGRTTDLAAARVRYAAAGHPDEHTHRFLTSLLMDPSEHSVPDTVRAVLAYGHSSGADTLVGLLAGIRLGGIRLGLG